MRGKVRTFSDALAQVSDKLHKGRPAPTSPTELSLCDIREVPLVFQHRNPHPSDSKAHMRGLAEAIQRNSAKKLEPITVWWAGRNWVCIDGHHRMGAYRKALEQYAMVPVQVFSGTLDEALTAAAAGNTHDKLPMTTAEKLRAAWRLVCTTKTSRAQIVAACGVGEGSVASMRRAFHKLGAEEDLANLSWYEARLKARGKDMPDMPDYDEAWIEKTGNEWALQIRKVLPRGFEDQLEVLIRALEILHPRLPQRLREAWADGDEEECQEADE